MRRAAITAPLAAGLLLLPAGAGAAAAPAAGDAAAQLPRCPGDRSARCGRIRVPLHRTDPSGPRLTVRFRVYPRTDRARPAAEPIVAVEGGPGYGSIDSGGSYRFLLGPLRRDHDLILVDNRGTGRSGAIDCPRLQAGKGVYTRNVGRCARQLGAAADAYGTGAAADDLAAILDRLGVPVVSIYGDSYGTYFAQAFAVRHPTACARWCSTPRSRSTASIRGAARRPTRCAPRGRCCARARDCPAGDPLADLRRLAARLERRPLTGRARDADGARHRVRLDGAAFAQLVNDAGYGYAIYRDLLAAGRAYETGDPAPLLRLAAEDLTSVAAGAAGLLLRGRVRGGRMPRLPDAVEPGLELRAAPRRAARRPRAARARRVRAVPGGPVAGLAVRAPARLRLPGVAGARRARSAAPVGATYPAVPVLVLNGDLDVITPLADAARAAALFPNATNVMVENAVHVTALADFDRCATGIVRRFLRTLAAGDTSCAGRARRAARGAALPAPRRRRARHRGAAPRATARARSTGARRGPPRTPSPTRSRAGG